MQTNAVWITPAIVFTTGTPPQNIDVSGWEMSGVARRNAVSLPLTFGNGRLAFGSGGIVIRLSVGDTAALGVGRVDIEVMRLSPPPAPRPILRFAIENHQGVYA
jgi:hypothetical protein